MNKQITAMPRYEAYKDSGIEWLGYIPSKWNNKRFKYLASVSKGKRNYSA